MGIGKTLSTILSEKKSNPNELAEKIGVSPSTIYSIIKRDNMKVDITVLAKICSALNVDIEQFYKEYTSEKKNKSQKTSDNTLHKLINNYNSLNTHGKCKLVEYSDDLINSQKYSDTVTIAEVARTKNNRKTLSKRQVASKELEIFDNAPQSDEEL